MTEELTPGVPTTCDELLNQLPELFEKAGNARLSDDPRFAKILAECPTCAELVRDLEYIAEQARILLEPELEPSPDVWDNIQSKLSAGGVK